MFFLCSFSFWNDFWRRNTYEIGTSSWKHIAATATIIQCYALPTKMIGLWKSQRMRTICVFEMYINTLRALNVLKIQWYFPHSIETQIILCVNSPATALPLSLYISISAIIVPFSLILFYFLPPLVPCQPTSSIAHSIIFLTFRMLCVSFSILIVRFSRVEWNYFYAWLWFTCTK